MKWGGKGNTDGREVGERNQRGKEESCGVMEVMTQMRTNTDSKMGKSSISWTLSNPNTRQGTQFSRHLGEWKVYDGFNAMF